METNYNKLPSGLTKLEINNITLNERGRELLKQGYTPVKISNYGNFDQALLARIKDEGFDCKTSTARTENGTDSINILWILT